MTASVGYSIVKTLHVVFMITWFAGLFYLPRLYVYLGFLLRDFARDRNRHGHVFYRWLNEIPTLPLLVAIVWLVVAKPF
jgi:uncharacterized membrane protein